MQNNRQNNSTTYEWFSFYIRRLRVGMSMIPGRTVAASSRIYSALNFDMMKFLLGPRYYFFFGESKIFTDKVV
jgi:hypothetical protein